MIYKCQVANYLKSEIEVVNNLTHFLRKSTTYFRFEKHEISYKTDKIVTRYESIIQ